MLLEEAEYMRVTLVVEATRMDEPQVFRDDESLYAC